MKPFVPYSLLLAAAATGMAFGQAYTTPVGYTTTVISGAFSASSPKNNVIAPDLQNTASWAGTVSSVAGDTLNLTNAALPVGAYNAISANYSIGTVYAYFVETADGYWAQIVSNTATSVTIEAGVAANFSPLEAVKIRRHVTIADYFGPTNSAGLLADNNGDPGAADNIVLIDEVNGGTITVFASNLLGGTWITDGVEEASAIPIYPDQGVQVNRRAVGNLSLVVSGEVDPNGRQNQVTTGVQIRPYVLPVATTLTQLGLYTGNAATGVVGSQTGDIGGADVVSVLVNGIPSQYFYSEIDLGGGVGWYDDSSNFAGATALPSGAALIINRNNPTNSAPFIWVVPGPTL